MWRSNKGLVARWSSAAVRRAVVMFVVLLAMASCTLSSCKLKAGIPQSKQLASAQYGRDLVTGKAIRLEDYRGKWVLLDVWASW